MCSNFGPMRVGSATELDLLVKQVSSITSGFLRDALALYKRGDKSRQDDFSKIFESLEILKSDRSSIPFSQHLEAIGAIIPGFAVKLLPKDISAKDHLKTSRESAQYYLNRILKAAKERYDLYCHSIEPSYSGDDNNIDWVNAMNAVIEGLEKDGLSTTVSNNTNSVNGIAADCQKATESNSVEENGFIVAERLQSNPPSVETMGFADIKDRVAELEGNRWYIRKAKNVPEPVVITPEAINQALAIEDSRKVAIKVTGKINAIIADKCVELDMEVSDVVSNIELLACTKVRLFFNGHVSTVVLDGCESVQLYISASSKDIKILSSKCAEINVVVQAGLFNPTLDDGDAKECTEIPIPVQFVTRIDQSGKLVTEPVSYISV